VKGDVEDGEVGKDSRPERHGVDTIRVFRTIPQSLSAAFESDCSL
jgi:hypothetical protein